MWNKKGFLCAPCCIAVVLLGVFSVAEASIEYTDIPDTAVSSTNANLEINFLGTGERQFDIRFYQYDNIDYFEIVTNSDASTMFSPWVASYSYSVITYDLGETIPGLNGGGGGMKGLVQNENGDPAGSLDDELLHYLGVSFNLSGETHYGWIAAQYNTTANELTVFGYAYETDVDTPIQAGATPEPATLTLMGIGAITLLRKRK